MTFVFLVGQPWYRLKEYDERTNVEIYLLNH